MYAPGRKWRRGEKKGCQTQIRKKCDEKATLVILRPVDDGNRRGGDDREQSVYRCGLFGGNHHQGSAAGLAGECGQNRRCADQGRVPGGLHGYSGKEFQHPGAQVGFDLGDLPNAPLGVHPPCAGLYPYRGSGGCAGGRCQWSCGRCLVAGASFGGIGSLVRFGVCVAGRRIGGRPVGEHGIGRYDPQGDHV